MPLAGHVGDDQAAAVQHADELLQLFDADLLRRKLGLELVLDLVEAGLPVEHLENGELFLLKTKVVESDGLLDDPIGASLVAVLARGKVGPHAHGKLARRAGNQAVVERQHAKGNSLYRRGVLGFSARPASIFISTFMPSKSSQAPRSSRFSTSARTR